MKRYYKHGCDSSIKRWYQGKHINIPKNIKHLCRKYSITLINIVKKYILYDNINNVNLHYPGKIVIKIQENTSKRNLNKFKQILTNNFYDLEIIN